MHQIGVGVLGPVFRTYEPNEDRLIAVKAFHLDITPEQARTLVAALERLVAADLSHPGLVSPIAVGLQDDVPYLAQEYASAESLDVAMRHYAPAPLDTMLPFVTQLGEAIDAAHAAGVVHGALHLRDIFVSDEEEVRVTGFGIVRALEELGLAGPIRRPYTAPEVIGGRTWGGEADLFALAAVGYELLTGRRAAGTGEQVIARLSSVQDVSDPEALQAVFATALADAPDDRFPSAARFLTALEAAVGHAPALVAPDGDGAAPDTPAIPVVDVPAVDLLGGVEMRAGESESQEWFGTENAAGADDMLLGEADADADRVLDSAAPAENAEAEEDEFGADESDGADTFDLGEPLASDSDDAVAPHGLLAEDDVDPLFVDSSASDGILYEEERDEDGDDDRIDPAAAGDEPEADHGADAGLGDDGDAEGLLSDGGAEWAATSPPDTSSEIESPILDASVGDEALDEDVDPLRSLEEAGASLEEEVPLERGEVETDESSLDLVAAREANDGDAEGDEFHLEPEHAVARTASHLSQGDDDEAGRWDDEPAHQPYEGPLDDDLFGVDGRDSTPDDERSLDDDRSGVLGSADDGWTGEGRRVLPPEAYELPDDERPVWMRRAVPLVAAAVVVGALFYFLGGAFGPDSPPESGAVADGELLPDDSETEPSGAASDGSEAQTADASPVLPPVVEDLAPADGIETAADEVAETASGVEAPTVDDDLRGIDPLGGPFDTEPIDPAPTVEPSLAADAGGSAQTAPPVALSGVDSSQGSSGWLLVRTSPVGATVIVDGVDQGTTPLSIPNLPFGNHEVEVRQDGYQTATRSVTFGPADTVVSLGVDLTPAGETTAIPEPASPVPQGDDSFFSSAVTIESRPDGARVVVDGAPTGTTPSVVSLASGSHEVRLELDGYEPWSYTVTVTTADTMRVAASLERSIR